VTVARQPKVKICGLTTVEDAVRAVELGADYLGLNFYPPSPRCLDHPTARRIATAVDGRCPLVGVFAHQSRREVDRAIDRAGLDLVQFHGDESAEELLPFADVAIKVFRVGNSLDDVDLDAFPGCWAYMLDRKHDALLGGTGESWTWSLATGLSSTKPLFVAGGIAPGSARRAASESRAFALDVCSGIESAPGKKDWRLMERLFEELEDGQ
jgi:phosphoribosylanthranilate isomerase